MGDRWHLSLPMVGWRYMELCWELWAVVFKVRFPLPLARGLGYAYLTFTKELKEVPLMVNRGLSCVSLNLSFFPSYYFHGSTLQRVRSVLWYCLCCGMAIPSDFILGLCSWLVYSNSLGGSEEGWSLLKLGLWLLFGLPWSTHSR